VAAAQNCCAARCTKTLFMRRSTICFRDMRAGLRSAPFRVRRCGTFARCCGASSLHGGGDIRNIVWRHIVFSINPCSLTDDLNAAAACLAVHARDRGRIVSPPAQITSSRAVGVATSSCVAFAVYLAAATCAWLPRTRRAALHQRNGCGAAFLITGAFFKHAAV